MASRLLPGPRVQLASRLVFARPAADLTVPRVLPTSTFKRGIKYGWSTANPRRKHAKFNEITPGVPVLGASPTAALERKANTLPLRTGVLAVKKGMTAIYDPETGKRNACTVLQLERVQVTGHKTRDVHGYWAVQVGCGWKHSSNVTRAQLGQYAQAGVSPKRHLAEFRVKDAAGLPPIGSQLGPEWFFEGQYVDARANCKGKGFAGGMKRWGWAGQEASHGNSLNHRTMGSAGGSQGSGSRVVPGKHMPGRMGGQQVTVQSIKVLQVDTEKGLLVVNGCVAGPNGGIVKIQDAIMKPWPDVAKLTAEREAKAGSAEAVAA